MKEITLQIEDDHYEIIKHFAELYDMPVEEYVLQAAKCTISSNLRAEIDGEKAIYGLEVHKLLGGEDEY